MALDQKGTVIKPPTEADMGWMIRISRTARPDGMTIPPMTHSRLMAAGLLEYTTELPKQSAKEIEANNKRIIAAGVKKVEEYLAAVKKTCTKNPQQPSVSFSWYADFSGLQGTVFKACPKLQISEKGWASLKPLGVIKAEVKNCGC